jgi:DNA repair protein RadD
VRSQIDAEAAQLDVERGSEVPRSLALVRAETRPALFEYQAELVSAAGEIIDQDAAALLSLPTGGGKTRTAVSAVLTAMTYGGVRHVVWLAPTLELLDQASSTFRTVWKDFGAAPDITLLRQQSWDDGCSIWLTTPQAVNAALVRSKSVAGADLVVFDEAHQSAARTFRHAVESLRTSNGASLIGLSATPGRTDPTEIAQLQEMFGGRLLRSGFLGSNPVLALQRFGVLARLRFRRFTEKKIGSQDEARRIEIAARAAQELVHRGRHVLVFAASVGGAYLLRDILNGSGIPAQAVDASLPENDRAAIIESFAQHKTAVLVNQRLLATGYDCPAVTDVFLLTEVRSAILFEQMVGRAARGPKTGGAHSATIWEFDDHLELHGLPSSYYRFADYDWS